METILNCCVIKVLLLLAFTRCTDAMSTCLACQDQSSTIDCHRTQKCGKYEECYLDSYVNPNAYMNYNMGCRDSLLCTDPAGRRSLANNTSRDVRSTDLTIVCSSCCQGDICNSALCGEKGFPAMSISTRGPICYDCPSHLHPDDCNIINTCSRDEVCLLHYQEGRYVSRCAHTNECAVLSANGPAIVGKRAIGDSCHTSCCNTDLCNGICQTNGSSVNPGHVTPSPTQVGGFLLPATDCFYASTQYAGLYRTSVTGKTCLYWETSLSASGTDNIVGFQDGSAKAASNKCRDPYGRGQPWCFTSQNEWEFCPVPYCQECVFDGVSASYDGFVSNSVTNNTCDNWSQHTTSGPPINDNSFPDGSIRKAKNYCRDPFGLGNLYCYDHGKTQACTVPSCPGPCADNQNTDCSIISTYVCGNNYLSKTLCPKTCGVCGFGLLPATFVQPPEDICRDNEKSNCGILKDIICNDPTGALKYCAKTCNLCYLLYTNNPLLSTASTPATTLVTTPLPTVAMTTTQPATVVTTSTPAPFWSPFGPFQCKIIKGTCLMYSYRFCSTGNKYDCNGAHFKIQLCTRELCPDMYSTVIPATTTVDPCQDDPKYNCNAPDLKDLLCKEASLAKQNCPKTCGFCGPNCTDYLDCSSPSAIGLFCTNPSMSNMYCRKSCHQCDKPTVSVQINSCGDPVAHVSVCEKLNTELCICNDRGIGAFLCPNYCSGTCSSQPDLNCTPLKR